MNTKQTVIACLAVALFWASAFFAPWIVTNSLSIGDSNATYFARAPLWSPPSGYLGNDQPHLQTLSLLATWFVIGITAAVGLVATKKRACLLVATLSLFTAQADMSLTWTASSNLFYAVQVNHSLGSRFWQTVRQDTATDGPQSVTLVTDQDCGFARVLVSDTPLFTWGYQHLPQTDYLARWVLGSTEVAHTDLDHPYEWYRDQSTTGYAAGNNCGPTSCEMAARWFNPQSTLTAEAARAWMPNGGGWWYISWCADILSQYGVPTRIVGIESAADITNILAAGSIAILCIDLHYLPLAAGSEWRGHGMYSSPVGSGHILIAKGFRVTNSQTWIECYDPASSGKHYIDGVLAGRDRHYTYEEITAATLAWWPAAMVIDPPGTPAPMIANSWKVIPDQHAP